MSLKEKILIADDSEMNQMLLEEILSDKYEFENYKIMNDYCSP